MADPVQIFSALADESRIRIMHLLSHGSFSVGELTDVLDIGQSTVSHHLKVLNQAGLTSARKDGRQTFYSVPEGLEAQYEQDLIELTFNGTNSHPAGLKTLFKRDRQEIEDIFQKRRDDSLEFFDQVGSEPDQIRYQIEEEEKYLDEIKKRIPEDRTVVDLGCGPGYLLDQITPRNGITIGVDSSPAMITEARKRLMDRSDTVDLRLGYLEHLPLADSSIDIAIGYMVFHHIPRPTEALDDIRRILRKNGELLIVDLTAHNREEFRTEYGDIWSGFNPEEVKQWLRERGFCNLRMEQFDSQKEGFFLYAKKHERE